MERMRETVDPSFVTNRQAFVNTNRAQIKLPASVYVIISTSTSHADKEKAFDSMDIEML